MIADGAQAARLTDFLDARGTTIERLLATVETSFGTPTAIVATGSILDGFGNERSDLDINVMVDRESVRVVPIPAFEGDLLIDTKYFTVTQLEEWTSSLRDGPWPPSGHLTRDGYRRRYLQLFQCVRFATGLVLSMSGSCETVIGELREPWLAERVAEWWRAELVRSTLAARWLAQRKPLLAAQRQCDAVLAALERRAALGGQLYFKQKWLSEKLRVLGDDAALETLRGALRLPVTAGEVPDYLARSETLLAGLGAAERAADDLAAQLWYAPGVTTRPINGTTLVSRWQLRGLELRGAKLPPPDVREPIWEGPVGTDPETHLLELFIEDLTWLSIVAREP